MIVQTFIPWLLSILVILPRISAHSIQRNPLRHVSLIHNPKISTPSRRAHHHSVFDLTFSVRSETQEFRLALEPNNDILHESMHINYLRADGTLSHSEPLQRHEHKIYRGHAFIQRDGKDEWKKSGWARITVLRDGKYPIFEGAFRVKGDYYHVKTGYNYQRTRLAADPDPDTREDPEEYMVVWKDSDIIADHHQSTDLRRDAEEPALCGSNVLDYNADFVSSLHAVGTNLSDTLLARQVDSGNGRTGWNLRDTIGETRGCPSRRQIALIGVATDCTYSSTFNSTQSARSHIIMQVNSASELFENSFNIALGIQNLTISESACPDGPSGTTSWNTECNPSINIDDRLNDFSAWRGSQTDNNAFWTLLSACGSGSSVGVAWLGQACAEGSQRFRSGRNVAGANVVIRTRNEWQVFAHEAGHIFGAVHDCDESACRGNRAIGQACCPLSENACDAGGQFMMNPSVSPDISVFSPCSIGNVCGGLRRSFVESGCLTENRDVETISDSQCGNGIVEVGEDCDCGGEDGCGDNSCCDPQTCSFIGDAVCDPSNQACCNDQCQVASQGTVCRESTGGCDPEEVCPGDSAACPEDRTLEDGDSCGSEADGLTCASGQCTSRNEQCESAVDSRSPDSNATACGDGCTISCRNPSIFNTDQCREYNQYFLDGTPCGNGGMCRRGSCQRRSRNGGNFWSENNHILIPVIASVGGVILIVLAYCCCVSPWLRKRKAKKAKAQSVYPVISSPPMQMGGTPRRMDSLPYVSYQESRANMGYR